MEYLVMHGTSGSNLNRIDNFFLYRVAMDFFRETKSKSSVLIKIHRDVNGNVTLAEPKKFRNCTSNNVNLKSVYLWLGVN
jgi:hypothetical protein